MNFCTERILAGLIRGVEIGLYQYYFYSDIKSCTRHDAYVTEVHGFFRGELQQFVEKVILLHYGRFISCLNCLRWLSKARLEIEEAM